LPTYEYRCEDCDENFDVVQSFKDNPLQSCPTCGSPVRKVFGNVGIVFKGSGFYKTDSREKRDKKVGTGAEKGDGTSTGASDSSGKPAPSTGEQSATSTSNGSASGAGGSSAGTSSSGKEPAPASPASKAEAD
jgi:putative FmdB family regulatory protein